MKLYLSFGTSLLSVLLVLLIPQTGRGQDPKSDSTWSLIVVKTRTSENVRLVAGQELRYCLRGTDRYVHATITEITDSTVSLQRKDKKTVTVKVDEFAVLKIQRSPSRRTWGTVLTVIGGVATSVGIVSEATYTGPESSGVAEGFHFLGQIIGAGGVLMLAGGIALKSPHKIDFENGTWKLSQSNTYSMVTGFPKRKSRFGVQLNYATSSMAGFGMGGHAEFFINDKFSIQPEFNYYFPKGDYYGFPITDPSWTTNVDVHYYFTESGSMKAYGLGGFSLYWGPAVLTTAGVNLGIGSTFGNSSVLPFAELKYNSPLSGLVITAGVRFGRK